MEKFFAIAALLWPASLVMSAILLALKLAGIAALTWFAVLFPAVFVFVILAIIGILSAAVLIFLEG